MKRRRLLGICLALVTLLTLLLLMPAPAIADEAPESAVEEAVSEDMVPAEADDVTVEETTAGEPAPLGDPTILYQGTCGGCSWAIDSDGLLTISPTDGNQGMLERSAQTGREWPWLPYKDSITAAIVEEGVATPADASNLFDKCTSLVTADLSKLDTSATTNMWFLFFECTSLESLDVSGWDTSHVREMVSMFFDCYQLKSLDLSSWDVSSVRRLTNLFHTCHALTTIGDVSGWNTSSVTDMSRMFYHCRALESVNLSSWNVSSVTTFEEMFYYCAALTSLDLSGWNPSSATTFRAMFEHDELLTTIGDVSGWNTSNVSRVEDMFAGCASLKSLDLSGWNTSKMGSLYDTFTGCSSLTTIGDTSGWNTSSLQSMTHAFEGCSSLRTLDVSGWDVSSVESMEAAFAECSSLTSLDVSQWDVSKMTTMARMFQNCSSLKTLDVSNWKLTSCIRSFFMFSGCTGLTSLDLSGWDTRILSETNCMFSGCTGLTSLDLSGWDTSKFSYMDAMFSGCSSLTSLDLSGWDVSSARRLTGLFYGCTSLRELDLSNWDTSNIWQGGMSGMFDRCTSLAKITVGPSFKVSEAFPAATAAGGRWWSEADRKWYTVAQIQGNREGVADTYCNVGEGLDVPLIPIYRMYNTKTSEHLWTKSKKEYDSCGSGSYKDWRQENVAWYSPNMKAPASYAQSTQGDYVYVWRLYDKGRTGDHIYLTYGAEMKQYLANGWVVDKGAGFWTLKKGTTMNGRTTIPIYRAYNPKLKRGKHHYTPSKVEYDKICKNNGWKPEGVKFYVIKK